MYFNETLCQIKMSQISVSSTPGFQAVTGHTVLITFPLICGAGPLDTSEPLADRLAECKDQ